mmetsp:Transcript_37009/g.75499  ORF Transcript_37009/g.75499 Transcript_37009/m.75499 type:complete len:269 (+) Transcript_37009:439-1245(+)
MRRRCLATTLLKNQDRGKGTKQDITYSFPSMSSASSRQKLEFHLRGDLLQDLWERHGSNCLQRKSSTMSAKLTVITRKILLKKAERSNMMTVKGSVPSYQKLTRINILPVRHYQAIFPMLVPLWAATHPRTIPCTKVGHQARVESILNIASTEEGICMDSMVCMEEHMRPLTRPMGILSIAARLMHMAMHHHHIMVTPNMVILTMEMETQLGSKSSRSERVGENECIYIPCFSVPDSVGPILRPSHSSVFQSVVPNRAYHLEYACTSA